VFHEIVKATFDFLIAEVLTRTLSRLEGSGITMQSGLENTSKRRRDQEQVIRPTPFWQA